MPTYTEPVWGIPQEAVDACSSLVSTGPTPFMLTGILTRLLQYHFSDPRNIAEPKLKCNRWVEGNSCDTGIDGVSGLWIGSSYSEDTEGVQATPQILVKRGDVRTQPISQKNISVPGLNAEGVYEGQKHQMTIQGVHNIICKAATGAAADVLGEEVFQRFLNFQTVIRDDFRLGKFQTASLSESKEIAQGQDADSGFYTVVRIEWAYVYRWLLRAEGPSLKRTHFLYKLC
jgi:hypothetical protein